MPRLLEKLETTEEQILSGKKAIADALIQVGITAVEPNPNVPDKYETFQSYADKVKRLMISNSMILEIRIDEEGFENLTKYKRTVFLPMSGIGINNITVDIINSDTGYTPSTRITRLNQEESYSYPTVVDPFGNIVSDGTVEYVKTKEEIDYDNYQEQLLSMANEPSTSALEDNYSFTVDWGDGTPLCEFISLDETPEAVYHEYTQPGTYDITINGIFKILCTYPGWSGGIIGSDGNYVYDKDGVRVQDEENYGLSHYLIKVIAWGNTQLSNCLYGLCNANNLVSIPMLDTTNSFENVTNTAYFFYYTDLNEIPYDSNIEKGLFTNLKLNTTFLGTFQGCPFNKEIPPKLISGCESVSAITSMFSYAKITEDIPSAMFEGLPNLNKADSCFYLCNFSNSSLPSTIFDNCPSLITIKDIFYSSNLIGSIPNGIFKKQSSLKDLSSSFYSNSIEEIEKDAFSGLTNDVLWVSYMFGNCDGFTKGIEEGTFLNMTGSKVYAPCMFMFSNIPSVPSTLFDEISHFFECRGMFSYCHNLTSSCPSFPSNGDFNTYSGITKYLGIFGGSTKMTDFDTMPAELGGNGNRLFPNYNVGKILLDDGTFVEINDLVYDTNNKPIGFCFHSDDNVDKVMALNRYSGYIAPQFPSANILRQSPLPYTRPQIGLGSIISYDTMKVYDVTYPDNKSSEQYTRDLFQWDFYVENKDNLPGWKFVEDYHTNNPDWFWHLPNIYEVLEIYMLRGWMRHAWDVIINRSNGEFTSSNCRYPTGPKCHSLDLVSGIGVYTITNGLILAINQIVLNTGEVWPILTIQR